MNICNIRYVTLSVKKNVLWLQVAIDDAVWVKMFNGECYLGKIETRTKKCHENHTPLYQHNDNY